MNTQDLTIQPTDGAITCIYKAMVGKGWMTRKQLFTALEKYHLSESALRTHLGKAPEGMIEERASERTPGQTGPLPKEIRLMDDFPMPVTILKAKTKKQTRESDPSLVALRRRLREESHPVLSHAGHAKYY